MRGPPFERVVFDCDSTLSRIEGIEELARSRGQRVQEQIEALTAAAMDGRTPLEEVYGHRLQLVAPTREEVAVLGERYVAAAVPEARETIAKLLASGLEVRVVSGGVDPAVSDFARWLGVPAHAVSLRFDGQGRYLDYDRDNPLARAGGKRALLASLPPRRTAFVGDGMTDAETRDMVEAFIVFTGVVRRPEVVALADVEAHSLESVRATVAAS